MRVRTFSGGVHPHCGPDSGKKSTKEKALIEYVAHTLVIPMIQHIGAYCNSIVASGDSVALGQMVGEPTGLGAPIHSSVSGKVIAVEPRPHVAGLEVMSVVIENDDEDRLHESIKPYGSIDTLSGEQIKKIIFDSGMVGMGGATFPTHVKLNLKPEQKVEYLILNGAECEPYLTCDYRTMIEHPEKVVYGALAVKKAVNAEKVVIGIEDNKPDAISSMKDAIKNADGFSVQALETKYPQGGEKQLIKAITGRSLSAVALPITAGCIVINVGTAAQIGETISTGIPLVKRGVTITGKVSNPSNVLLRIGTKFSDAIEFCGGFIGEPTKIISGGPMMGFPVSNIESAITKGTSGILVLDEKPQREESNCIKCGRCIEVCPMKIEPTTINAAFVHGETSMYDSLNVTNCMKCGCCSYICPASRRLTQTIDLAKRHALAAARK